ncbi:hypothetical protein MASR2M78_24510 [Treponema sp.]
MKKLMCAALCCAISMAAFAAGTKEAAGETTKASAAPSTSGKLFDKEITLKVMRYEHPSQPIKVDSAVIREIFNKTNVRLEIEAVPQANYEDKKKILIATNNIPDIILVNRQNLSDFGTSGIFLPLKEYIRKSAPNFSAIMATESEIKKLSVNNELYGFPTMMRYGEVVGFGPVIRKDLLKKHNLAVPGSFTELYTVLKKLKELYPQSYPMTARLGTKYMLSTLAYPMGSGFALSQNMGSQFGLYFDKDAGNKYIYGPGTEEFKNVITTLNMLFKEGILDPDYAVNTAQQWSEKLTSGRSFFFYDNSSFSISFTDNLRKATPDAELGVIPIMKNSQGIRRNFFYAMHWWDDLYAISSKTKDPAAVVKFMDYMYSTEGADIANFGILGEHYTKDNGEYKVLPSVIEKYASATSPLYAMYSDLGTGLLSFCPYEDERPKYQQNPVNVSLMKAVNADPGMVRPVLDPPFTNEENARIRELRNKVENTFNMEIDKFIMGAKPMSEYNAFAQKVREQGGDELASIYNAALERFNKSN